MIGLQLPVSDSMLSDGISSKKLAISFENLFIKLAVYLPEYIFSKSKVCTECLCRRLH